MRNVTVAAVQMKCSKSVEKNIAHAEELVRICADCRGKPCSASFQQGSGRAGDCDPGQFL